MKHYRRLLLMLCMALLAAAPTVYGQNAEYNIACAGQGKDGAYMVKVTTRVKDTKKGVEELKKCAVHGVMFRGFMGEATGCTDQKPLIKNPNVAQEKADFFTDFFTTGGYARYVSYIDSSFTSTKIKRKNYEVSAIFLVDKESLLHYLEQEKITDGFSNLW